MPAKQKVTLYISDDLHRQFKIRSAVDGDTMSSIAQRAIEFYLGHADVVEGHGESVSQSIGQAHRIHTCPECSSSVAIQRDGLTLVKRHAEQKVESLARLGCITDLNSSSYSSDEGELITC